MKKLSNILVALVAVLLCATMLTVLAAATGEGEDNTLTTTSVATESEGDPESDTESTESVGSDESTGSEGDESTESGEESGDPESGSESDSTTTSEIRISSDQPIGGVNNGDWTDTDMTISVVSGSKIPTSSNKDNVKKDIFDLRGLAARLMVLTTVVGLLCLLALVYVNIKYKGASKDKKAPKKKLKAGREVPRRPRS